MINITSQAIESISLITTTESTVTTMTTNTNTISSSSSTTSTTSLTNNSSANNQFINNSNSNNSNDNSVITINCSINSNSLIGENNGNLNISTLTITHTNSANNHIPIDSSDSNNLPDNNHPNLSSHRDISCIDLTEGDDDIEIITEKLIVRPHKKRKCRHTPSSNPRPCRHSLRESSTTSHVRTSSCSHRSVHHRTSHHHQQSLTPPIPPPPPPLLPVPSLEEQLSISPPRSDSFIVDLANSPSPSTSSSSNKNSAIDLSVESKPKRKNIVENKPPPPPPPPEPVQYKIVKCPICLEEDHKILAAGGEIVVTICGHVYCKSCIQQAIKTNHCCPKCRKKLNQKNFHRIFL